MLLLVFSACSGGGKPNGQTVQDGADETVPQVFRGIRVDLPDDDQPVMYVTPYADAASGTVTVAVYDHGGEDGAPRYAVLPVEITENGAEAREDGRIPLALPEGETVSSGILTADGYTFITVSGTSTERVYRVRSSVGGVSRDSGDLTGILESGEEFRPVVLSACPDGSVWLMSTGTQHFSLAVLEPDLTLRRSWTADDMVDSVAADRDGDGAWILSRFYGVRHMDRDGLIEDPVGSREDNPLNHELGTLYSLFLLPSAGEDSGYVPACVTDKGIEVFEDGVWRLVMSYTESGVTSRDNLLSFFDDRDTAAVIRYAGGREELWLYRRAEVSEPSPWVRVVDIAICRSAESWVDEAFRDAVTEFNATHADIQVKVTNYAEIWRTEPKRALEALERDIVTGVYRPDILYLENLEVFQVMAEHGMALDLTPYIDRDPVVNRENLFGSVLRTMEYDGKIWALPQSVRYHTLVGLNSVLGEYAGRDGWTFEEELAFLDSLPEDVERMEGLTQDKALGKLFFYTDLRQFIDLDNGTCSFDSPDGIALFRWISGLPASSIEYRKKYPQSKISGSDFAALNALYADGRITLSAGAFSDNESYVSIPLRFLSTDLSDVTLIGYPRVGEDGLWGGIVTEPSRPMMILSTSAYPDEAWEFLKAFLTDPFTADRDGGASPLRTVFERAQSFIGVRIQWADGTGFIGPTDPNPGRAGLRVHYGREETMLVETVFDSVGAPWLSGIGAEVSAIIAEELSALTAGSATPESCAKSIQSRVSIWLAENRQ